MGECVIRTNFFNLGGQEPFVEPVCLPCYLQKSLKVICQSSNFVYWLFREGIALTWKFSNNACLVLSKYVIVVETEVNGHVMEGQIYLSIWKFVLKLLLVSWTDSLPNWWGGTREKEVVFRRPSEVKVRGQRSHCVALYFCCFFKKKHWIYIETSQG